MAQIWTGVAVLGKSQLGLLGRGDGVVMLRVKKEGKEGEAVNPSHWKTPGNDLELWLVRGSELRGKL